MMFFCPLAAKTKVLGFFERPVVAGRFGTCGLAVLSAGLDHFYRCVLLYGTTVSLLREGLLSLLPFCKSFGPRPQESAAHSLELVL